MELVDQLSQYGVKLLDKVRGNEELDLLLNVGYDSQPHPEEKLARFKLALEYKEKRVGLIPQILLKTVNLSY